MNRDERGAGTILTIGAALILITLTGFSAVLIAWFSLIRHAEQAAEFAALAGATAATRGADACEEASRIARENRVGVRHCAVRGAAPDVVVEIGVATQLQPELPGAPEEIVRFATAGVV